MSDLVIVFLLGWCIGILSGVVAFIWLIGHA